jgi:hypothetical protein
MWSPPPRQPDLVWNRVKWGSEDRLFEAGAGDGTRTRDNLLGRQELYHLSYSRKIKLILAQNTFLVKGGARFVQNTTDISMSIGSCRFCVAQIWFELTPVNGAFFILQGYRSPTV